MRRMGLRAVNDRIIESSNLSLRYHNKDLANSPFITSTKKAAFPLNLGMQPDKLVVDTPELINEITDAMIQQANGVLVCHTNSLLRGRVFLGGFPN